MRKNRLPCKVVVCPMVMVCPIGNHRYDAVVVPNNLLQIQLVRPVEIENIQEDHCDLNNLIKIIFAHFKKVIASRSEIK